MKNSSNILIRLFFVFHTCLSVSVLASEDAGKDFKRDINKIHLFTLPIGHFYATSFAGEGLDLEISPTARTIAYAFTDYKNEMIYVIRGGLKYDTNNHRLLLERIEYGPFVPGMNSMKFLEFSPDCDSLAIAGKKDGGFCVMLNGKTGKPYDSIISCYFSPNGKRFAYIALEKKQKGKNEISKIGKILNLSKSGTSKSFRVLVVDGQEIAKYPLYPALSGFTFGADSKRYAYKLGDNIFVNGKKRFIRQHALKDGKIQGIMGSGELKNFFLSPTKDDIAYSITYTTSISLHPVRSTETTVYFVNNKQLPGRFIAFSPNGEKIAYLKEVDNKKTIVVEGRGFLSQLRRQEFPCNGSLRVFAFSPDSKQVAYAVERDSKCFVAINGEEGKEYDDIIYFYSATPGQSYCKEKKFFIFSPDSTHIACTVRNNGKFFVVVDNKWEGKKFDDIQPGSLAFSPDSRKIAYIGSVGKQEQHSVAVVADLLTGKEEIGKPYEHIYPPVFSPNGKYLVYLAEKRVKYAKLITAVINGVEGESFPYYPGLNHIYFISSDTCYYILRDNRTYYLIEETLHSR